MENFEIKSSTVNSNYEFTNDYVIVEGSYSSDATTKALQNVNGTVYYKTSDGERGEYVGNFNGNMRNGEILYTLSEMSRSISTMVWDAIDSIEQYILGSN